MLIAALAAASSAAQTLQQGPFKRLVIRGAMIIDGSGGPTFGPADVVVENDRITDIQIVGDPRAGITAANRPARGDHEIDAAGMYLLPGLIDGHVHMAGPSNTRSGLPADYYAYLNLVHGITSVVDVVGSEPLQDNVALSHKVERNEVIAPRVFPYARLTNDGRPVRFEGFAGIVSTPEKGREWVRAAAKAGAVGLKLRGNPPEITEAIIDEAHKLGLKTTMHMEQLAFGQMNLISAARMGLDRQDHWYGLAESMLTDRTVPTWDPAFVNNSEDDRWREAGRTWEWAAEPGSEPWNKVMDELLERHFTMAPTMVFYDYLRNAEARRTLEMHQDYTAPGLMQAWEMKIPNHPGITDWTTQDETNWYNFFIRWQTFLREFNRRGGHIVAGSDSGSGYSLWGFGLIRELELLQQAGLAPTEVIRSATLYNAQFLGAKDLGTVAVGKIADLFLIDQNPLNNLKVLYANGHLRYNPATRRLERIGGVKYTIRGGVVYDAAAMNAKIKEMVKNVKR
ncbi:MAG: amidohydrolase family protein [Acidobacteria bacterium]|nr:amidohydrolase family protein [Acidobacteriota bacterium]